MLHRQLAGLIGATLALVLLVCAYSSGIAGPQEKAKSQPPAAETAKKQKKVDPRRATQEAEKRRAEITRMLAEYDLKPHPWPSIPDDPPPHEGAMISLPHLVEPPDLVIVEVLEALPGRPISGERLVKGDGTISLGFYGDVHVKGLTLKQVKTAIIKHLRNYLTDQLLGLETQVFDAAPAMPDVERPAPPELPKQTVSPIDLNDQAKAKLTPRPSSETTGPAWGRPKIRSTSGRSVASRIPVRLIGSRGVVIAAQDQEGPAPAPNQFKLPVGAQGKVTITIELDGQKAPKFEKAQPAPIPQELPDASGADEGKWTVVPPAQSTAVFVDVTAYNSQNYYVLGDLQIVGRLPWTGHETLLDAIQFSGGLVSSAEPKDIRLVRPGRDGKPAKVYKVDLAAIQEKGDVAANYQIFPNDRLIVGRNEVVAKTVEIDRLNAPIQSITGYMLQEAFVLRYLQILAADHHDELLKELVDFWAKEIARPGGVKFDEQTLREALLRKTKLTPAPSQSGPAPR